jgi:hypothetical protein
MKIFQEEDLLHSAYGSDSLPSDGEEIVSEDPEDSGPSTERPDSRSIAYEDPWKILSGWAYASQFSEEKPTISVWAGGCTRITDKLRPELFGSKRKNTCNFTDVRNADEVMYFISNSTFWGRRIQKARRSGRAGREREPIRNWAETLWRRLSHFVRGRYDPSWTVSERSKYLVNPGEIRDSHERLNRLVELLKTVDGIFLQRFLTFPEERWDWEKFDIFVIQSIQILITDEFLDGELTADAMALKTQYARLKSSRKLAKLVLGMDDVTRHLGDLDEAPRWVQAMLRPVWDRAARLTNLQRVYAMGTLSQTRGSGTPPPLVVLQSKEKFIKTVSEEPRPISGTALSLVDEAMEQAIREVPGWVFTGLATKAKITVTGSASWEKTRSQGGTAQAILEIMKPFRDNHMQIPVRCLDTGRVLGAKFESDFESLGEAIFYAAFDEVLRSTPEELRRVFLAIVKEPGKARSVSKGMAALKIVLDFISRICSWPLKKGFASSESGMGKSNHGWNYFRDMFTDEFRTTVFSVDTVEDEPMVDYTRRHIVWKDAYASSTDYEEATDRMSHSVARIIADKWMRMCGIPPVLQGIVHGVCYEPRYVYFTASGHLASYGEPVGDGVNRILLKQGVLMGDPLTKVVLHFSNIVSRKLGTGIASGTIFLPFRNGTEAMEIVRETLRSSPDVDPAGL